MELQRIPEWYSDRLGKFTASEFHKLMSGGRRDMTPEELAEEKAKGGKRKTIDTLFGETALSYIDAKVTEILTNGTGCDYGFQGNKATEWGEYWEPIAKEKFIEKVGMLVEPCGFINISERFGGSPDGLILGGHIEIKCPYKPENHVQNLWLKNAQELKEKHFEYYVQCQVNLIAVKGSECFFVSFDPRMQNEKLQMKIIPVPKDNELIEEIQMRYTEALKTLKQKINLLFESYL